MIEPDRRPGRHSWLDAFRRRGRDERGQVIPIVAIMMVVFVGLLTLTVDLGSYDQAQRQTQATADAAALAGSYDLPTSTTQAIADAQKYVTANFPGVPTTQPCTAGQPGTCITFPTATPANSQIKVVVTVSTPTFFGKFLGLNKEAVGASAVAAEKAGANSCATPGSTCYAIFAMDSSCVSGHYGITLSGGGNTINGGIFANGNIYANNGGSSYGPSTYGPTTPAPACTWTNEGGGGTWASGPTSESAIVATWPIDYSTDFPACTGTACTGQGGTPSACTQASTSTSWSLTPVAGNIYCDVGGGTPGTPSTWNGAISFGSCGSTSSPLVASYVAASVSITAGGCDLEACGYSAAGYTASTCSAAAPTTANYPLMYAVGTSSTAINGGGGGSYFDGDLFAPNGTITFNGGGDTTSFLEGKDVVYSGGGLTGDGPSTSGSILGSPGSQSLVG
jgi:Flp pilus assembly protein TadG